MTVAIVYSRALSGMHAPLVRVEVHLANGLPAFNLVGLPETEVKESRERVRAALQNAQFGFPTSRRITVNLAPADLPKESGRFDLPIAIGILVATEQVPGHRLHEYEFAGELGLSGELDDDYAQSGGGLCCAARPRERERRRATVLNVLQGQTPVSHPRHAQMLFSGNCDANSITVEGQQ